MVGTLVKVGEGELSVADFKAVLEGLDRTKAGMNVPPHGLYFLNVVYDVGAIRRG
jgi:tRNA pseudouridine38-40 synthase